MTYSPADIMELSLRMQFALRDGTEDPKLSSEFTDFLDNPPLYFLTALYDYGGDHCEIIDSHPFKTPATVEEKTSFCETVFNVAKSQSAKKAFFDDDDEA